MKAVSQTNHHPVENHCFSGLPIFVMESELPAELKVKSYKSENRHIKTYYKTWSKITTISKCNLY